MIQRIAKWAALLVVVAAAGFGGWWWLVRKPADPEIRYETAPADRGRIASQITASGTLSALVTVQVGAQVSGRIDKLNATFNSVVKKGDIIALLEPGTYQADVQKSQANLFAAAGNLAKAKAQADLADKQAVRARDLKAAGLATQADLDAAEAGALAAKAEVEAVKGSVEQARAALNQSQINLAYTTIRSPIDGVVISRNVDVGQTVAASLSAPTLFTIAEDLRKMQVDTFVAEADVGKLAQGMAATFTVDAFPGRKFQGIVREVRNAPQTVQNVVTYDAVIDVDNPAQELRPGMTANVTVVFAEKPDVLRIPNAALRFRPGPALLGSASPSGGPSGGSPRGDGSARARGSAWPHASGAAAAGSAGLPDASGDKAAAALSRKTLYVMRDGTVVSVRIRIGITDGSYTEVTEGDLKEGDLVVTAATGGAAASPSGSAKGGGSSPGGSPGGGMRRMF